MYFVNKSHPLAYFIIKMSEHKKRGRPVGSKTKSHHKPKQKKEYKLLTNPPEPVTRQSLMQWLSDSGWVEGFIGKKISPLDRVYFEDYVQECWLQILLVPEDKILDIWYRSKGRFINYIKSIVVHNIYSYSSHLYKNIRAAGKVEKFLTDEQWQRLEDTGESEYEETFPINDFENNNRSLHYGVDIEKCNTQDEYRCDNPQEIEW